MSNVSQSEQQAFFQAINMGDRSRVRSMIQSNPELLNCFDERNFGATPLTAVCFAGRREFADELLSLGADPNRRSQWPMGPWSPLHCAAYRHDHELALLLLSRGATLDVHGASALGRCDAIEELLSADPSRVHERGGDGCFPLHFAETVNVAALLISRGADIEGRCVDHHSTATQYLCTVRPEVARYLFAQGAAADVFSATLAEDLQILESLLSVEPTLVGARINQTFFPPSHEHNVHNVLTFTVGFEATPLHAAAAKNRIAAIGVLLKFHADVNARGGYDQGTALHVAAWNDSLETAECLIANGADINLQSGKIHNNSPAGWAIVAGSLRVFELLMDRGAAQFPWFLDDAKDGCDGRFDGVSNVPRENRERILRRLTRS